MKSSLFRSKKLLLYCFIFLAIIPVIVFFLQKQQDPRSRAAGENASLRMPSSVTPALNQEFDVPITLSTDGVAVRGVDIVITFDRAKLSLVNVGEDAKLETGLKTFTPLDTANNFAELQVISSANQTGKIAFSAISFDTPSSVITSAFTGTTVISTLRFKALQVGSTTISFASVPSLTTDTNIVSESKPGDDLITTAQQVTNTSVTVATVPTLTPTLPPSSPTPTGVGFSPTPTRSPTPTVTPTRTPTPVVPTSTPIPTNTPVPNSTKFNVSLLLHGIGKGGDNANPTSLGNQNPIHPQKTMTVELYNSSNTLVKSISGTVTYNPDSGNFTGLIDGGTGIESGSYLVKVKGVPYLRRIMGGITTIISGQTITVPQDDLTVGDANNDNQLNILDYNLLLDCYSELTPARDCNPEKLLTTDFNDDGSVNQFDYNLFLRELSNLAGQ